MADNGIVINLKLLTTTQQMLPMISSALAAAINERIENRIPHVKNKVANIIKARILKSPEYQSLMGQDESNSSLRAHFGLISPESVVSPIIETWLKNIVVTLDRFRGLKSGKIKGSLKINAIHSLYLDVKSLPTSSYTSKPSGQLIPWLEWLLEGGSAILINDYGITFDVNTGVFQGLFKPRSGKATMINEQTTFGMEPLNGSFTWSVPPQYAGVKNDNWITRALIGVEDEISRVFMEIFR